MAGSLARTVGDQAARRAHRDLALPLDIAVEQRVHDGGAARIGQNFAAQPDQSARRHMKLQADPAGAVVDHLGHLALARAQLFNDHPEEVLGTIDDQKLQRLLHLAVDGPRKDFRLTDHQLEPLAAHHLDDNGELELAAAHHLERVRAEFLDANGDVGQQLLVEPVAQVPRGDPLPFPPAERRRVDRELHRDRGFVDMNCRERFRSLDAGDGLADGDAFHAGDGEEVARQPDGFVDALEPFEGVKLGDFRGLQ